MTDSGRELARFAAAGVAGLAVDVAVLYLALAAGCGPYGGRVLSFLCAVFATWQINRRYTFAAGAEVVGGSLWREWWRYLVAMLGGGLVNYGAYSGAIAVGPRAPLWPMAAVALGSLAGMAVNFASAKFFVFKR
ncbi:MAG: GtrA family protein [Pseudomonadota bacterium]|nr:GtrA family protein [Pseudomonadota bacterium]